MKLKTLAAASLMALTAAAQAATGTLVYSDDFNSATRGYADPAGWTTPVGSVDVVGGSWWGQLCATGQGNCIDLDGSSNQGASPLLSQTFAMMANTIYTAYFDLAGNQRISTADSVTVVFGTSSWSNTFQKMDSWATYSLSFTTLTAGNYTLSFSNAGGDNTGAMLDNVKIFAQAVPEPEQYAMLLAGLGLMGFIAARRRRM